MTGLGLKPGLGCCAVFLDKTGYFESVQCISPPAGWVELNAGGSPAMD